MTETPQPNIARTTFIATLTALATLVAVSVVVAGIYLTVHRAHVRAAQRDADASALLASVNAQIDAGTADESDPLVQSVEEGRRMQALARTLDSMNHTSR